MGARSRGRRDSFIAGARARGSGFTLIELMFTMSLAAIVLTLAVPSFGRINADIRTRTTAEQLAGALRLARISAVTKHRPAAFVLTNATPGADAAAAADGSNWLVRLLPSAPSGQGAAGAQLVQAATVALQNRVKLTGPAQVCFDALGMQAAALDAADGVTTPCAQPGSDAGGATSYLVARTGATRQFKVRVYRTGSVEICDASKARGRDPDGCP